MPQATVTVSPATVNGKNALISPGVGATNQPLPPVMTVWLAASGDPTHPVLFGTGTRPGWGRTPMAIKAWQTSITAPLNVPSPGDYTVYVYGDDGSSRTNSRIHSNAGYNNADTTTSFIQP